MTIEIRSNRCLRKEERWIAGASYNFGLSPAKYPVPAPYVIFPYSTWDYVVYLHYLLSPARLEGS